MKILRVGYNSCGIAAGAEETLGKLYDVLKDNKNFVIKKTGCNGMCYLEPVIDVIENDKVYTYGYMTLDKVDKFIETLEKGEHIDDWIVLHPDRATTQSSYQDKQVKVATKNIGAIDPENIDDYIAAGGYSALEKAVKTMDRQQVIEEVKASGLRGRGGAGFSCGMKWQFAKDAPGDEKYVICNGDEGDPGAFMDRSTLEGDPHGVIEGMTIAAYAVGAQTGFFYVRAEYPLAVKRLRLAIEQAEKKNFSGKNILGTDFSVQLHVIEGAGAFVCGEETALIASIEGKRGMPRTRPPFPATHGIWGKPTNNNNVETYANIPYILREGGAAFSKYGTETSKGTKVFALAGKINRGGMIEVPMGITINEIVNEIGGGIVNNGNCKAVQMGGPSGGCIPAHLHDTPIDYEKIMETGAIVGSGGMVFMDHETCMVDIARYFLSFTVEESCGKCTFCRVGTKRMLEILERITAGKGQEDDIPKLRMLCESIIKGSLCGLGQTAPNPVLTTLRYFLEEYEAHIRDHECPAKKCKALISYHVVEEKCTGCTLCSKTCPVGAVTGERKKLHYINNAVCTRCGFCKDACKFDAIVVE
ncbi:MAG: NADH-quinone oxidoreductase subunit NuoF [Syntrophobacterales bacterium]|jgi:NADH-quinone oxidoreductase subunit F|nr:NADH-quinone oxidoreductase subunit NuoF [Syntrophobacterales bacterium]